MAAASLSITALMKYFATEHKSVSRGENHYKSGHVMTFSYAEGVILGKVHASMKNKDYSVKERPPDHSPHSGGFTDEDSDEEVMEDQDFFLEKTKDKNSFVLVVDDLKDDVVTTILHDLIPPEGFDICNTQRPPGIAPDRLMTNLQMFTQLVQVRFQPNVNSSLEFSDIFNTLLRRMCFKLRHLKPCCLTDICFNISIPDEDEINIAVTGCCVSVQESTSQPSSVASSTAKFLTRVGGDSKPASAPAMSQTDDMMFPLDGVGDQPAPQTPTTAPYNRMASFSSQLGRSLKQLKEPGKQKPQPFVGIELTPLNVVRNGRIDKYLGYYNFFFIRESTSVREYGGIGGFMQSFIVEVMAIVRAHVSALGGHALVAYTMCQCVLDSNPHKNQGQCLINVSGDVVAVSYDDEVENVFLETPAPS